MTMPHDSTSLLQEMDNHFVHPWEDVTALGSNKRTMIAQASGVYITDTDGHRMIDGPGGMWCVNVGYGREEIIDAIADQLRQLSYFSPWSLSAAPTARLAERLAALAPGDLDHVFFTTCGSTAVDSALRFVFFYNNCRGRPEKKHVISRIGAYHGSTYLAAACSGKMSEKQNMDMADERVHLLPPPNPRLRPAGTAIEDFCDQKVADLENKILELGPDRVAAFIAEPILASGGVIVPPAGYHQKCREVCRKHDVLYISDEVVTAFGRLGHHFASEDVFGVVPDIITTAKGLTSGYVPMGAVLISDRLIRETARSSNGPRPFFNGFTYSGHPVAAAAALASLDIVEREDLLGHVRAVSGHFRKRLKALEALPVVAEVRVAGLMAGVECMLNPDRPDEARDCAFALEVDKLCQALGLMVRPVYNTCVMSPPLIISETEIDEMARILRSGIEQATANARAEANA